MTYEYRLATMDDADAILAVLEEVAPEIPLSLHLPGRKELVFERIKAGETWIALDHNHQIVGVLLAEPDKLERFLNDVHTLELSYGDVKTGHRGQGIFATLVAKMKAKGVQLTVTVKHANASSMANRMAKLGFTKLGGPALRPDEDRFRWTP
jgi:hypothetical protein